MASTSTGAAALLASSVAASVEVCFANPGTTEMWLVGAMDSSPDMRGVLGLHENVCTGAADGYARMARKPALVLLHLGVGLANGLANLHNARRAGSPIVVLVGEMATWHRGKDSLLEMDVVKLAGTVSKHVHVSLAPGALPNDLTAAVDAVQVPNVVNGSRIATLVMPHDRTWEAADGSDAPPTHVVEAPAPAPADHHHGETRILPDEGAREFFSACAQALKRASAENKRILLYAGGEALVGDAFKAVGRIAASLGGPSKASVIIENAFARVDRGAGFPLATRIPYFPQEAKAEFAKYHEVLCLDARLPVALFGYKDGPSDDMLPPIGDDHIWQVDTGFDVTGALHLLEKELGSEAITPGVNCRGSMCPPSGVSRPALPASDAKLSGPHLCTIVAHHQPENTILVDESLTSGGSYWDASAKCPPFSHLALTGGAIGIGMPMAVGAAVACPDRVVINLQADGSGMYTCQSLWTQARERLRVLTIVCFNNAYQILKIELMRQRIQASGPASRSMTDLGDPPLQWEELARGMGVSNVRGARTCGEMSSCMEEALRDLNAPEPSGPWVIVANLT